MIETRRVEGEELLDTVGPLRSYAFSGSPQPEPDVQESRQALRYHRETYSLVTFEDGRPMCTASSIAMTQNVRGRILPMAAIAGVATHPEARRKGYQRALLTRLLADQVEAGTPVSCLYPFRDSFYERLGYAGLPQVLAVTLRPERLAPLLRRDLPGRVRLTHLATGLDEYRDLLGRLQRDAHGLVLRDATSAERIRDRVRDSDAQWVALAEDANGVVVGALPYKIVAFVGELRASALLSLTLDAHHLLVQWLARHVDQVSTARILMPSGANPELWQTDLRPEVSHREDQPAPMGRVLSVTALSGIRAGDGEFTARVSDPACPWNEGTFRFRGEGGTLAVSAVEDAAEFTLPVQGLSALVYAGYDPAALGYRGWGDPPVAAHERIRSVFPAVRPYLVEEF